MSEFLFTYGTLQPGHAPAEIAQAVNKLRPVGKGVVNGALYDLGDYPGAILDPASGRTISGTVFKLANDANILRQLDEYEGFDPRAPQESLFLRQLHPVTLTDGKTKRLNCWVYVYNRKPDPTRLVHSGIYAGRLAG